MLGVVGTAPTVGFDVWAERVATLADNSVPWAGDRAWMEWYPSIAKGLERWALVGGAERERRETIAAGRAAEVEVRKARKASWWAELKAKKARLRDAASWWRARVKWAKGVLRREAAEGGVACVYSPNHNRWPPERQLSPGVALRDVEETERAAAALLDRREALKLARAAAAAEIEAVCLGVDGGPGVSERGVKAAKTAVVASSRAGGEAVDEGVCWRVVRARGELVRVSDGGGDGVSSPEVLRRLRHDEARRRGGKPAFEPGLARRLLRLLVERRRARASGVDAGRVRADLMARFDDVGRP